MRLSLCVLITLFAGILQINHPALAQVGTAVVGSVVGGAFSLSDGVLGKGQQMDRRMDDLGRRTDEIGKTFDKVEESQKRTMDRLKNHEQSKEYKGY